MVPYNTPAFSSGYASLLYGFVESKRLEGCKYNGEVKELQRLDARRHPRRPSGKNSVRMAWETQFGIGQDVFNQEQRIPPVLLLSAVAGGRCAAGPSQCKGKTERERFHPVYFHA